MTIVKHTDYSNLFDNCVFYLDGTSLSTDLIGSHSIHNAYNAVSLTNGRHGVGNHAFNFGQYENDAMGCDVAFRYSEMTFLLWYNFIASQPSSYSGLLTTNYTGASRANSASVFLWDSGSSSIGLSVHRDDTENVKRIQGQHGGAGVWNCVVCGFDASNVIMCSNGTYSSGGFDWTDAYRCDHQLSIGGIFDNNTLYNMYNGLIGEIAIWNRLLSESEMKELYRVMASKYIYPSLSHIKNVE